MRTIVLAGNLRSNEKQDVRSHPPASDNLCGQVDMFDLCGALHDVGYSYMLMPDHAPNHPIRASVRPTRRFFRRMKPLN